MIIKDICGPMFIELGGPDRKIQVGGKVYTFEMHPYCGPVLLNKRGDPAKAQPIPFLKAVSLWAQQGEKIEGGLCVWYHEPKMVLKHLGGKNYEIVGYEEPVRGE